MFTWKKAYESHPFFIAFTLVIMLIIQLQFTLVEGGASLLNPVLAVSVTYGFVFGKKSYLPIVVTLFVGHFVIRFFFLEMLLSQSLFIGLFLSVLTLIQVEIALRLAQIFDLGNLEGNLKVYKITAFLLSAFLVALIGAYFGNVLLILSNVVSCSFYRCFSVYLFGDFMALTMFVPTMILAYRYDPEVFDDFSLKKFRSKSLFVLGFIAISIVIALEHAVFDYERHKYLILLFYIPLGFVFNYRMIHYLTLLFLLISKLFYLEFLNINDQLTNYIAVIIFLGFATLITLSVKRFYDVRVKQYHEIKEKNRLLDLLLDEVYRLLRLSSDIIDSKQDIQNDYLVRTFQIAYKLFKAIDAGFAYRLKDGVIEPITYEVYDDKTVPYLYETQAIVENDQENLFIYSDFKGYLKQVYGEGFDILDEGIYPIKARIIIALHYQKNESFIMILDRFSSDAMDAGQIDRLNYFAKLLDGLYKRNYFIMRNANLKDDIVLSIIRTLELYDPYTKGHSEDVAALSLAIGEALNLDEKAMHELYFAAILHDIGKVGVDSKIINKPAKLTKSEYDAIKKHSDYGFGLLSNAESLKPISKVVKHHHEWFDGNGYPDGLKGETIPLASRIIAVADMVSTMATDRPYRKHLDQEIILNELAKYQGTQFDPTLTKIMIDLISNGLLKKHFYQPK
jgi:HD-GYP domain-containing protein (c-di-GMP phosphodiesterase class II)